MYEDAVEELVRLVEALMEAGERAKQHAANLRENAAEVMGVPVEDLDDWTLGDLMAYADLAPVGEDVRRTGPKFRSL